MKAAHDKYGHVCLKFNVQPNLNLQKLTDSEVKNKEKKKPEHPRLLLIISLM